MGSPWRDLTRVPRGMQNFGRWFPDALPFSPSDVDGVLHSRIGNRILFLEFKPVGLHDVPRAQNELLEGLSRKPGIHAIAVFDPGWNDTSDTRYEPDKVLRTIIYRDGERTPSYVTVGQLGADIEAWYSNTGPLSAPLDTL